MERIIEGSDLALIAADQPFFILQRWVNKACTKLGVPLIGGGINLTAGQFFTILPGQSGCIDCMHLDRIRLASDYPHILARQLEANFIPPTVTIAPNIMMITSIIATEAAKLLTGIAPVESVGKMITVDFMNFEKGIFSEMKCKSTSATRMHRSSLDGELKEHMLAIHRLHPYYGYKRMRTALQRESLIVNQKKVRRLMRVLEIRSVIRKKRPFAGRKPLSNFRERTCTRV